MRSRYRTEEYAINNGDYRTSTPKMETDEIAQIKAYIDQKDQLIISQHNADKATQESRDTEQDNQIFQNATDIGINQMSIANLTNKNTEQDARLDALENRPVGTSGSMSMNQLVSEIVITDENQSIIFDNLDAIADGGYVMTVETAISNIATNLNIYLNDDKELINYMRTRISVQGTAVSGGVADGWAYIAMPASGTVFGVADISANGKVITDFINSDGFSASLNSFTKIPLDNVTKIELDTDTPIPIGSRISLYKRKTEIKPSLVEEIVLDADSTSIVFDNLDAVADGGYEMNVEIPQPSINFGMLICLNDDNIASNYRKMFYGHGVGGSGIIDDNQLVYTVSTARSFVSLEISENEQINAVCTSTNDISFTESIYRKNPFGNINKIELLSSVENAIPAGTKVSLYRRKHDKVSDVSTSERTEGATDSSQLTIGSPTTESLSGIATSQSEVNAEFVTEISEHETRITTLEASSGSSSSYQLGDIILQNSEWVNDFVEINGMTFVKCNSVAVESSLYPFIGSCSLATPLASAKKIINMTSSNTPEPYVVNSDGYYSSHYPWKAFDGVENIVGWGSLEGSGGWISIDLGTVTNVNGYDVNFAPEIGGNVDAPKDWVFQGSDDGINWITVDTRTGQTGWASPSTRHFDITETSSFKMYRMNISSIQDGGTHAYIGEISLYVSGAFETPTLYITDPNTTQNIYYYMRIK